MRWVGPVSLVLGLATAVACVVFPDIPPGPCSTKNPGRFAVPVLASVGGSLGLLGLIVGPRRPSAAAGLILNLIAWMARPSLVRYRPSPDESTSIGEIRSLLSAESAYESTAGYYDKIECLVRPSDCILGYSMTAPTFLDSSYLSRVRHGYRFTFHPGRAVTGARTPSALESFAYTAVPEPPGGTGRRGFCTDNTGRICFTCDGSAPVSRAECDLSRCALVQ